MTNPHALYYPPTERFRFLLVSFAADGTIEVKPFATEEEADLHGGEDGPAEPRGVKGRVSAGVGMLQAIEPTRRHDGRHRTEHLRK